MANLHVKDGASASKYMKTDGAGTDGDPHVPHHILDSGSINITNTVAISGIVTANAGMNLNTSALALESGGNLATIAGAVSDSEMQVDVVTMPSVAQATHDNLNANVNLQVGDADVANGNPVPVSDAGGSLTVDGTVAVSSGSVAITNTITETNSTAIKTAVETIDNAVSGNEILIAGGATQATDVKVTLDGESVAISSGSVDITNTVTIQDGGNTITIDGTVTVQDGGSTISVDDGGSSLTVDGTVAISSGSIDITNTVTVDANQLDIDDLDKDSDEVLVWANTAKDGTGTDYVPLVDGDGHLQVDVLSSTSGSVDITNEITIADIKDGVGDSVMDAANNAIRVNIIAGAGTGGTAMVDDAAFTPATTSITPIGAMLDDVTPDSIDEGDAGVVRMSANRNLYVTIRDAASNERGLNIDASGNVGVTDAGGSLTVDGTVAVSSGSVDVTNTVTVSGTVTANLSVTDNTVLDNIDSNTDYGAVVGGGAEATALRVTIANDSTGVVSVDDGGSSLTVDGTVAVSSGSVNLLASDGVDIGNVDVASMPADTFVAEDGSLGKGVLVQGDDGTDRHNLQTDASGYLKTLAQAVGDGTYIGDIKFGEGLPANSGVDIGDVTLNTGTAAVGTVDIKPVPTIQRAAINSSGSGNNTIIAADGSDKRKIIGMTVVAAGDVTLTIQDGAGGSALFGPVSLAADGNGFVLPMTTQGYHWFETSAATLLNFQLDAAVQVGGVVVYYTES